MTIRSYIDKNLTHLNWNILPQIFESEGVELTEEIERYLRETPKNTNWNVFGSLGGSSVPLGTLFIEDTITISSDSAEFVANARDHITSEGYADWNGVLKATVANIVVNGKTYYNVPNISTSSPEEFYDGYFGDSQLIDYPFYIISNADMGGPYIKFKGTPGQTYNFAIYYNN